MTTQTSNRITIKVLRLVVLSLTLATLALLVGGCGARLDTPTADYLSTDDIGTLIGEGNPSWVGTAKFDNDVAVTLLEVERVVGKPISAPIVVKWSWGPVGCGIPLASGCYHYHGYYGPTGDLSPWIEVSTGWDATWSEKRQAYSTFHPKCVYDTALAHELVHYVAGIHDGPEHEAIMKQLLLPGCD